MKLRIRGDSIRLRLTRGEVDALVTRGKVEETTRFADAARLGYALALGDVPAITATFTGGVVCVTLPEAEARAWATTDRVGLEAEQPIEGGARLRILVEKDFACLAPRAGEDDSDAFANPNETC